MEREASVTRTHSVADAQLGQQAEDVEIPTAAMRHLRILAVVCHDGLRQALEAGQARCRLSNVERARWIHLAQSAERNLTAVAVNQADSVDPRSTQPRIPPARDRDEVFQSVGTSPLKVAISHGAGPRHCCGMASTLSLTPGTGCLDHLVEA